MFKVVCIKPFKGVTEFGTPIYATLPVVGKIYTVINLNIYKDYVLLEIGTRNRSGIPMGYDRNKFAIVDESFAEGVLESIKEQIEQEELVTI